MPFLPFMPFLHFWPFLLFIPFMAFFPFHSSCWGSLSHQFGGFFKMLNKCKQCNYAYNYDSDLRNHLKIHIGEK